MGYHKKLTQRMIHRLFVELVIWGLDPDVDTGKASLATLRLRRPHDNTWRAQHVGKILRPLVGNVSPGCNSICSSQIGQDGQF